MDILQKIVHNVYEGYFLYLYWYIIL